MPENDTLLKRISISADTCGGRPRIKGHRITVEQILELLAAGISPQDICAKWFPTLQRDDIYAAIAFATQFVRNEDIRFFETLTSSRR